MIIQYGIGENYLKDWGIQEALREVYQNFMDYGKFTQQHKVTDLIDTYTNESLTEVILSNNYLPENLEFLKIGESEKGNNKEAIGQHGEGLKMAFLIFLRENYKIQINTHKHNIEALWNEQPFIGKSLAISVDNIVNDVNNSFTIRFFISKSQFDTFNNNLIKQKDILFHSDYYGDIVNKSIGNFYVGKLFVCNIKNFKKSYNLNPSIIKLDRDRKIPGAWESSYFTSKLNEAEGKFNFVDQNYDDMKYVSTVPHEKLKSIKPKIIGNNIEFIATENGQEIVVKNEHIKVHLKSQSYFKIAVDKIKQFLISKLGVNDLLIEFRQKYCNSDDAREAFDVILDRLGIKLNSISDNKDILPF
jgi:hypothetical protein